MTTIRIEELRRRIRALGMTNAHGKSAQELADMHREYAVAKDELRAELCRPPDSLAAEPGRILEGKFEVLK